MSIPYYGLSENVKAMNIKELELYFNDLVENINNETYPPFAGHYRRLAQDVLALIYSKQYIAENPFKIIIVDKNAPVHKPVAWKKWQLMRFKKD